MIVIFCQSPIDSRKPDELYQAEAKAAHALGIALRLINFEALVNERNVDKALHSIPSSGVKLHAVYRGWMMPPETYTLLFKGLCARGIYLINDPAEYRYCHYLPEWLAAVGHNTPQTTVLPMKPEQELSSKRLAENIGCFGSGAIIVKDFVKSEKHHWAEACFIPDASDTTHALKVVRRFLDLRGSDLQGGLVFRKFVPFRKLGKHPKSGMPLTEEFRTFVLDGAPINVLRYWDEVDYPEAPPDLEKLLPMVASVPSRFFTVDFARLENGNWMVVELGDGQVTGLPDNADVEAFYRALQNPLVTGRPRPQIRARIRMYKTDQGGVNEPLSRQIRCPMRIEGKDDAYHDCNIDLNDLDVSPGEAFEANIEFLCPQLVAPWLKVGIRFSLWAGRVFAEGEMIEVFREW